jgi:hypothetical protein
MLIAFVAEPTIAVSTAGDRDEGRHPADADPESRHPIRAGIEGLAAADPFPVHFHNDMMEELKRLDAVRFVQPKPGYGLNSIRERDGPGDPFAW